MKYIKKPIVVDAWRYVSDEKPPKWLNNGEKIRGEKLNIITLDGTMTAYPGDWIIKGVEGEIYLCKPHIFEKTYEAVDQ